jgi:cell division protein ZapA
LALYARELPAVKRSIAVTIAGQHYTIKSDADASYVQSLAEVVNERIREVQRGAKSAPLQAVAVLAALQLADEVQRERDRRADLRKRVREKARAIRAHLSREVKA